MSISRRSFLRTGALGLGAAGFLSAFERFGLGTANAASSIDPTYKALVVVFLFGGNDTNNMVIPNDATGKYAYAKYAATRNPSTCDFSIPQPGVGVVGAGLPIAPLNVGGSSFMFHPSMTRLQALFSDSRKPLAVLCNVGTLVEPTKKNPADGSFFNPITGAPATLPEQLMSHRDQQDEWQTGIANPELGVTATGWGGRIADHYAPSSFPLALSDAGSTMFTQGEITSPIVVSASGTFGLNDSGAGNAPFVAQLAAQASGQTLTYANQKIMGDALAYAATLNTALAGNVVTWRADTWDNTGALGLELKKIAEVIAASGPNGLALTKQVFFCSKGGFDTHADQGDDQAALLAEVDNALAAFYDAMTQIGAANKVVLATQSDFSRTFAPGSFSGTDHAWGTHQLILGNAVNGSKFFGTFPDLTTGQGDDMDGTTAKPEGEGRWVPTTSVEQYAATLAKWLDPGLDLAVLFPNLVNFTPQTLNFV
jgi:uncharacterized protein (DUF1501 family)